MKIQIVRPLALVLLAAVPALAGASVGGNDHRCGVTDLPAFEAFIGSKPTPVEFRAAYSCVTLALPGDFTTRELRHDNSRYFADLDAHGRIVGGHFQ